MRDDRRRWSAALPAALIVVATVLAGGCIRPYQVIQQAQPNPFLGGADFKPAPIAFQGLQVGGKTEAAYLGGKDPGQRSSWEADKQAMTDGFIQELTAGAGRVHQNGRFSINPQVTFIEPGFYVGVAAMPSEVQMTVTIQDEKGAVLDVVQIGVSVPADISQPAVGQRLRSAAQRLGAITAGYLLDRMQPQ